jgi:hypothetical protein
MYIYNYVHNFYTHAYGMMDRWMDCDGLIEYDRMIEQISSAVCFF